MITFDELVQAQEIVDSVLGTNQVQRPVEVSVKRQWSSYDWRRELTALFNAVSEFPDHPIKNGVDLFWAHVHEIAGMLEPNGTLYSAAHRDFFFKPKKIAAVLVEMGHVWVNWKMVEEAQRIKQTS